MQQFMRSELYVHYKNTFKIELLFFCLLQLERGWTGWTDSDNFDIVLFVGVQGNNLFFPYKVFRPDKRSMFALFDID